MVGDSMRALLLEHMGYSVKIFEFAASEKTPKKYYAQSNYQFS